MATLNFDLKQAPRELYEKSRWNVLTQFILHANGLNRCFPKLGTIASRIGSSVPTVVAAKKWLLEKGAITLVPYKKRVGEELACPKRQHVYQLTGVLKFGNQTIPYLYFGPKTFLAEISPSKTLPTEISSTKSSTQESLSISNKDSSLESTESDSSKSIIGETLPRSPDTAHTEIKSEPVKAEPPIQEPLIPESSLADQAPEIKQDPIPLPALQASKGVADRFIDSAILNGKDDIPPARDLPPVPEGYEAVYSRIPGDYLVYHRHYRPKDKISPLCGKRAYEERGPGFDKQVSDYQCPTCAAKLAERQAKAAARAEKAPAAKKPSAYSNQALFDAIGAMLGFKDKADVNANGWLIGEIRKQLVTWALEKLNVQDLTKDQIDRLKIRLEGFPEWYAKECKGCDLPGHKLFMKWWTKYAATFTNSEGGPRNKRPWFETLKGLWFEIRDGVTYAKRPSDEFWAVYNG